MYIISFEIIHKIYSYIKNDNLQICLSQFKNYKVNYDEDLINSFTQF